MDLLWASLAYEALMQMKQHMEDEAESAAAVPRTIHDAYEAQRVLRQLRMTYADKIDRLVLVCRAVWELIREYNNLSEDDLLKKVTEVDLRDGTLDGKIRIPPKKCSNCNRLMAKKHMRCIYCGAEVSSASAFDSL